MVTLVPYHRGTKYPRGTHFVRRKVDPHTVRWFAMVTRPEHLPKKRPPSMPQTILTSNYNPTPGKQTGAAAAVDRALVTGGVGAAVGAINAYAPGVGTLAAPAITAVVSPVAELITDTFFGAPPPPPMTPVQIAVMQNNLRVAQSEARAMGKVKAAANDSYRPTFSVDDASI